MPDCISILKKKLDIRRPIFLNSANPAIFHLELSPTSDKEQPKCHLLSPGYKKGLSRTTQKIPTEWEFRDCLIIANNKSPKGNLPLGPNLRKQSNTADSNASTKFEKPFKEKRTLLPVPSDASDPPCVEANMKGLTQTSSFDPEITKSCKNHSFSTYTKCFEKITFLSP